MQMQQQFGTTSDYWSTATSTSRSDPSIYLQQQQINSLTFDQDQWHHQRRESPLGRVLSTNVFIDAPSPNSMLTQANDDYYLDVAAAQQSYFLDHHQRQNLDMRHQHQQLQPAPMQTNESQFLGGLNRADIDDNEYLRALSGQLGFSSPQPPAIITSSYPNNPIGLQQPMPQQSFGVHPDGHRQHLINLYNQNQLTSLMLSNEDYDDYAIPTDEYCCRLDRSQVELVQMIGEGQKGYVFLGKLQSKDGQRIIDVAIKTLKYETNQLIDRLMSEAAMMRQLEHPHIIRFIGVCPETPALIAMELALFGELKQYLKSHRHLIRVSQLILFTFQISTALSYLESKHYVHRDVAARNVLVCSHNCVKLADFDLTRNLQQLQHQQVITAAKGIFKEAELEEDPNDREYISAPRVKLPVRWLAPESLIFRRFTSASDVWMFAVCCWELFQLVQVKPWPQLRNNQVLFAIESGQRLPRPANCPLRLYQLLLSCWDFVPNKRPKFREIKQSIWSIYLSERTREQMEFEQMVRKERQRLTSAHSFETGQQQLTTFVSNDERRLPISPVDSNATTTTTPTELVNTNNDYDGQQAYSSAANSLIGSLSRGKTKLKHHHHQQQQQAIGAQMSRFERCLPTASAHRHQLQKQRSQGTITQLDERQPGGENIRNHSGLARRQNHLNDDAALLSSSRSNNNLSYDQWYAQRIMLANNESLDDEDYKCDTPTRFSVGPASGLVKTKQTRTTRASRQLNHHQASPACDSNRVTCAQILGQNQSSRTQQEDKPRRSNFDVAAENELRNLPASRPVSWQLHVQPPKVTNQMVDQQTRRTSPNQKQSSEGARQHQQNRFSTNSPLARIQEHDQLGQVLQTLSITPAKRKSKSPPAHQVRVFSREVGGQQLVDREPAVNMTQQAPKNEKRASKSPAPQQQDAAAPTSQLQLHQRLLGRIKLATTRSSPAKQQQQQQQQQQQRQQRGGTPNPVASGSSANRNSKLVLTNNVGPTSNRVETVDQSLQILQSLIANPDLNSKRSSQGFRFGGTETDKTTRGFFR